MSFSRNLRSTIIKAGPRALLSVALCGAITGGATFGPGVRTVRAAPPASHEDAMAELEDLRERIEREVEAARSRPTGTGDGVNVVDHSNVVVVVNSGGGSADASARQTIRVRQNGTETVVEDIRD